MQVLKFTFWFGIVAGQLIGHGNSFFEERMLSRVARAEVNRNPFYTFEIQDDNAYRRTLNSQLWGRNTFVPANAPAANPGRPGALASRAVIVGAGIASFLAAAGLVIGSGSSGQSKIMIYNMINRDVGLYCASGDGEVGHPVLKPKGAMVFTIEIKKIFFSTRTLYFCEFRDGAQHKYAKVDVWNSDLKEPKDNVIWEIHDDGIWRDYGNNEYELGSRWGNWQR